MPGPRNELGRGTPSLPGPRGGSDGIGFGPGSPDRNAPRGDPFFGDGVGPQPGNSARDELNRLLRGPATPAPTAPRSPGTGTRAPRQTPQDFSELVWSGERAPLAIVYGRARVRGFPWVFEQDSSNVVIGYVVALGEIEEVEDVYINSVLFDAGSSDFDDWEVNTYTGTSGQTADPLLASAISASPGYDDDLDGTGTFSGEGIAYVVISAPGSAINGIPVVEALVKGRKVSDPRTSPATVDYSDNPALCLADLIDSDVYGWGKTLDLDSVGTAADACDETVSGAARRSIGYALYDPRPTTQVVEELADIAGVMLDRSGDTIRLVPDRPRSVDLSLSDETQIVRSAYNRKRTSQIPAAVEVSWYDADAGREKSVREPDTQTDNLWRVRMAGIPNYNQALREAKERYNRATLEDLSADIVVTGVGSRIQIGDVVNVTDRTIAITDKPFRVQGVTIQQPGVHRLALMEYQAAVYSDDTGSEPVVSDTDFSDGAFAPPAAPTSFVTNTKSVSSERGARYWTYTLQANQEDSETKGFVYRLTNNQTGNETEVYAPIGEDVNLTVRVPSVFNSSSGSISARSVGFNNLVSAAYTVLYAASPGSSSQTPTPTITADVSDSTLLVEVGFSGSFSGTGIPSYAAWATVSIYRTDTSPEQLIYTTLTTDDEVLFYYDKLATSQSYRAELAFYNEKTLSLESSASDTVST